MRARVSLGSIVIKIYVIGGRIPIITVQAVLKTQNRHIGRRKANRFGLWKSDVQLFITELISPMFFMMLSRLKAVFHNGSMIDTDMINVWCWDARPFPDFPARDAIWADGDNWSRGHWLIGRMGLIPLSDVVTDICRRSGLTQIDSSRLTGLVQGYHIDRPMTGRAALTPLAGLYGFDLIDAAQGLRFTSFITNKNRP